MFILPHWGGGTTPSISATNRPHGLRDHPHRRVHTTKTYLSSDKLLSPWISGLLVDIACLLVLGSTAGDNYKSKRKHHSNFLAHIIYRERERERELTSDLTSASDGHGVSRSGVTTAFSWSLWQISASSSKSTKQSHSGSNRWNVISRWTFCSNLNWIMNSLFNEATSPPTEFSSSLKTLFFSKYDTSTAFLLIFQLLPITSNWESQPISGAATTWQQLPGTEFQRTCCCGYGTTWHKHLACMRAYSWF